MPPPGKVPGDRRRIGAPESRTQIIPTQPAGTFRNHRPRLREIAGWDLLKRASPAGRPSSPSAPSSNPTASTAHGLVSKVMSIPRPTTIAAPTTSPGAHHEPDQPSDPGITMPDSRPTRTGYSSASAALFAEHTKAEPFPIVPELRRLIATPHQKPAVHLFPALKLTNAALWPQTRESVPYTRTMFVPNSASA